ncbi:MAG: sugar transferase [Thermoleophilaceae bacterium]|nr:sugar transferase [Thermoleophilaceae bacterium]
MSEPVGEPAGLHLVGRVTGEAQDNFISVSATVDETTALGNHAGAEEARETFAVRPLRASRLDAARRRALALADVLSVLAAYAVLISVSSQEIPLTDLGLLAASVPCWIVMNKLLSLYDRDPAVIDKSTLNELPRIAHSVLLGTALLYLAAPILSDRVDIGRTEILGFMGTLALAMPSLRQVARSLVRRTFPPEKAVVVGQGRVATVITRKIRAHPEYGIEVLGSIDGPILDSYMPPPGLERLGGLHDLEGICREHDVERLIVAFSAAGRSEPLLQTVRTAKLLNLKVTVVPRLYEVLGSSVVMDQVQGMTTLGVPSFFRSHSSLMIKRAIDIGSAAVALTLLAPVMLACAIAVKLTSRGAVLYRQQRIGKDGVPFDLLKFRTMVENADQMKSQFRHLNEMAGPMFKISDDPRITRVGRFLRAHSLDELPQLWNVLVGQMSLVGPRPLIPTEDGAIIGRHRSRLDLTPGLTGPWQALGRNAIPFDEMIELDYLYVADWSLWYDLKLLIRTVPVVALARGH